MKESSDSKGPAEAGEHDFEVYLDSQGLCYFIRKNKLLLNQRSSQDRGSGVAIQSQ